MKDKKAIVWQIWLLNLCDFKMDRIMWQLNFGSYNFGLKSHLSIQITRMISDLIMYMKKLLILIGWEQCSFSLTQCRKEVIECKKGNKASILIGQWTKKFTGSQSNLLFSNQARALDGAIMAQFFPDCMIRVRFFCLTISKFFMYIINK